MDQLLLKLFGINFLENISITNRELFDVWRKQASLTDTNSSTIAYVIDKLLLNSESDKAIRAAVLKKKKLF